MGVVDFHTHILPCMDDGSRSVEHSLQMLRMEAEQGIGHVVLTPHFYADNESPREFLRRRENAESKLLRALDDSVKMKLTLGAEVRYFEGISDCEFLEDMAVGETGCVLVEMPMRGWNERMLREVASIRPKRRLTPILAHLDRYILPFKSDSVFAEVAELPVMVQVNAGFFNRLSTRRLALRMLSQGKIHFLGSDCHNSKERAPNLGPALEVIRKRLGDSAVEYINSNENQINL